MQRVFQVLSDCPCCQVESALVEVVDPARKLGVAVESRCRMCGYRTELGEVVAPATRLGTEADALRALARWAAEEGEADLEVFARANFNGRSAAQIAAALVRRERIDTGFEVIAFLFPGAAGGAPADALRPEAIAEGLRRGLVPASSPGDPERAAAEPAPAPRVDPRLVARALVSVMMADGRIRREERRFIEDFLTHAGAGPLREEDYQVWRPFELGQPPDPTALLEAMRAVALADREADGTELRVLREYARAWRVPLSEESLPRPGAMHALGRILSSWFGG